MASMKIFVALALVAAVAAPAMAKDFVVGDDKGWTLKFDYNKWAEGKEFSVGDRLIFNYPVGVHNVQKVGDSASFENCTKPNTIPLATGNDAINLTSEGKKWYICGVGSHCATGNMKLAITVSAQKGSPAGKPSSGASGFASSAYFAWIFAAFGTLLMFMV